VFLFWFKIEFWCEINRNGRWEEKGERERCGEEQYGDRKSEREGKGKYEDRKRRKGVGYRQKQATDRQMREIEM
jgi:hypothetical protein